jgi:hypothetical protein
VKGRTVAGLVFDYWRGVDTTLTEAELREQTFLLESFVVPRLGLERVDKLHAGTLVVLTGELLRQLGPRQTDAVLAAFSEVLVFAACEPACPDCGERVFVQIEDGVGCAGCGWQARHTVS